MSHRITETDSMFSVNSRRKPPWHGLGVVLDEYPKSNDEALEKAGLGWKSRTATCSSSSDRSAPTTSAPSTRQN